VPATFYIASLPFQDTPQDGGSRFTAEKAEGNDCHVVAGLTLKELLDRLEQIEASQQ